MAGLAYLSQVCTDGRSPCRSSQLLHKQVVRPGSVYTIMTRNQPCLTAKHELSAEVSVVFVFNDKSPTAAIFDVNLFQAF